MQKALGKRNGFGDDVVAQQPPHPCLVVHNTVCHVTPCVFPVSEPRMEQCCSQEWLLCLWCQCFHVQSNWLGIHLPQCFHESALKVHIVHCHSLATLASVCWLCMKRNLVCNVSLSGEMKMYYGLLVLGQVKGTEWESIDITNTAVIGWSHTLLHLPFTRKTHHVTEMKKAQHHHVVHALMLPKGCSVLWMFL